MEVNWRDRADPIIRRVLARETVTKGIDVIWDTYVENTAQNIAHACIVLATPLRQTQEGASTVTAAIAINSTDTQIAGITSALLDHLISQTRRDNIYPFNRNGVSLAED